MGILKGMWDRIIVAFAQPPGKGTAPANAPEPVSEPETSQAEYAANEKEQWKHHGGSRH